MADSMMWDDSNERRRQRVIARETIPERSPEASWLVNWVIYWQRRADQLIVRQKELTITRDEVLRNERIRQASRELHRLQHESEWRWERMRTDKD